MPLPIKFPATTEAAIASFNYIDIAEGTGTIIFYGISSEDSSAVDYHLISNKDAFSSQAGTERASDGTTTIDFDLGAFNLPQIAKGTAYLSVGVGADNGKGITIKAQVKKYDGTTATNVTSEITSATFTGGAVIVSKMIFLKLPITQTSFRQGDILRLTVKFVQNGGAGNTSMGHDPKNRAITNLDPSSSENSTIMAFHMAFRIDL